MLSLACCILCSLPQQPHLGLARNVGPVCFAVQLMLTDGWYWIRAAGDERLTQLARQGRISQGLPALHAVCVCSDPVGLPVSAPYVCRCP